MTHTIELRQGAVYFLVGFLDPELRIPTISTYVYEGMDESIHLFIDAQGYLRGADSGPRNSAHYISFSEGEITGILDKEHLIVWLGEEHSPKLVGRTYEYRLI